MAEITESRARDILHWLDDQCADPIAPFQTMALFRDTGALIRQLQDQGRAQRRANASEARPLAEWHEDIGQVVWWRFPVDEPAWIGSPLDSDWPGYHTHWTPHPVVPDGSQAED